MIASETATPHSFTLADFDYSLPPELIAQQPLGERSAARLLDASGAVPQHRQVRDLPPLLRAGDVLVINESRVIPARLFARRASGGAVELLIERVLGEREACVQLRASHKPRSGETVALADGEWARCLSRWPDETGDLFRFEFSQNLETLLPQQGHAPLPPYITRAAAALDAERYQTVYAVTPGSVAAPTAGLHFDAPLLQQLQQSGVLLARLSLHVGAGTFQSVRTSISAHQMHSERFSISAECAATINSARQEGRRVIAVGTTSLRALESVADAAGQVRAGAGEAQLFITPGYRFRVVDILLTNFHWPRSTLLMLAAAFGGYERVMALYRLAIAERYRFYSYGDAMLLKRAEGGNEGGNGALCD